MFWSFVYFVVLSHLLGRSTLLLVTGRVRATFDEHVVSTGIGLATFTLLCVLLNTCRIPLTWWTFLLAGVVLLVVGVLRAGVAPVLERTQEVLRSTRGLILRVFRGARAAEKPAEPSGRAPFWTTESVCLVIALALTAACFALFLKGAMGTPWLSDDDSWVHAASAKHIAVYHTYAISPEAREGTTSYLEPYPPAYPVLMGVLNQVNDSIYRTLKFFNVLIIALGVVYFYLMAKEWTGSPPTALWMTGAIWIFPCFMSRFIWAQSLALVLFFPAFYALERTRREPAWAVVSAIAIAGILLSQPSSAGIFALMAGIYWVVNVGFSIFAREGRFPVRAVVHQALAAVGGLSAAAGFYVPEYLKFGHAGFLFGLGKIVTKGGQVPLKLAGTGLRDFYDLWDFIHAPLNTRINQPVGIGMVLFLTVCAGLVLLAVQWRRLGRSRWRVVTLLWLVFTVCGVMGNRPYMPVSLFPHRFWAFLAIPAAMLAGEFLAFVATTLSWRHLVPAIGAGVLIALILLLAGAGPGIARVLDAPDGARIGYMLTVALAVVGVLTVLIFVLAEPSVEADTIARAAVLGFLTLGIMLTSGYPKTYAQTLAVWPPGVHFYSFGARLPEGGVQRVEQHLNGYQDLRENRLLFRRNTPMLTVTSPSKHLIGSDMFTPPYDLELRRFRDDISKMNPSELDARVVDRIRELAHRKHLNYVLIDAYEIADLQYNLSLSVRWLTRLKRECSIPEDRLTPLLLGTTQPTEAEKPAIDAMRYTLEQCQEGSAFYQQAVVRLQRLRQLMQEASDFSPVFDSGPFGVIIFEHTKSAGSPQ